MSQWWKILETENTFKHLYWCCPGNDFLRKDKTIINYWISFSGDWAAKYLLLFSAALKDQFFGCEVLSDCSRSTLTSRQSVDHPAEWGSRVSRRGLTLYLLMWFWSFLIRAVRAVCRHEAQPEYTNPAAAWHRTHTQTLSQKTEVTASVSLHGRRQEK